jgi:CYTH domain-containing protein
MLVVDNPSAPSGKERKYARVERERRWLLGEVPDLTCAEAEVEITDIYFVGTRLRLRRVVDRRGEQPPTYKLAQKLPAAGGVGLVTNTYLSEHEYQLLAQLDGKQLRKVRYSMPPFGVDVFLPPLDGLVLVEAEFDTDEAMIAAAAPEGAVREVTDDPHYTGGHLAEFGLSG